MTDDELLKAIERIVHAALETYGLERLPSAGALRTRAYRERKAASQNVTRKRHKTSQPKGQGVTKASPANVTPSAATWAAYAEAYQQRYGVEPTRNATVNGQLAQFVARVPSEEAPQIAAFYVRHNKRFYISSRHAVGGLLHDAEGLRTEWLSGRTVTETEAHMADRTQTNANVWGKLIQEADDEGKQKPH
jgi:hypothetical protein